MRSLSAILGAATFLIAITTLPAAAQWPDRSSEPMRIQGGWIFDSINGTRIRNPGVSVEDGRIVALGEATGAGQLIELEDSETLLPGMIDLHAHYNFDLVDNGRTEEVVNNGMIFLANGVTTTWSAGEYYPDRVIKQRDLIDAGEASGPRLLLSGPYFGAFRCEYAIKTARDDCIAWPNDITEEEIRAEVDQWAAQGVISIKIKQASPGETKILIEQAHKHGMTATGHLSNYDGEYDVDLRDAILMGLDRVEHQLTIGDGGPRSADLDLIIELMIRHQVYYDANLQMYGSITLRNEIGPDMTWEDEAKFFTPYARELLDKRGPPPPESEEAEFQQRLLELRQLVDAGGDNLIVIGTDEPVYTALLPGFAYHRELLAMSWAGLPNEMILRAATINGAAALKIDDKLGSIEVGKLADMFVVRGDPLDDIRVARDIRLIIRAGEIYQPKQLLDMAVDSIGPKGPGDHADWELQVEPLRSD